MAITVPATAVVIVDGTTGNPVGVAGGALATSSSGGGSGGGPATIADGADVAQGAVADTPWSGSGSSTVVAALKAIWGRLAGLPVSLGIKTAANSTSVVLASDGTLPLPSGAATAAKQLAATSAVVIAAGASTPQTVALTNTSNRSIVVVLNTATASGGNTVQVTINGVTSAGYVYPILVGVAVAAVAVTPYRVGPGLTPSANSVANDVLPPTIQVVATVAGTVAYGVDHVLAA